MTLKERKYTIRFICGVWNIRLLMRLTFGLIEANTLVKKRKRVAALAKLGLTFLC